MSLIVNPCEKCIFYREQFVSYMESAMKGDYRAVRGMRTILDLAMAEEKDSEIEEILNQHSDICEEPNFCLYRNEELNELSESIDFVRGEMREMNDEERSRYLIESYLKFRLTKLFER